MVPALPFIRLNDLGKKLISNRQYIVFRSKRQMMQNLLFPWMWHSTMGQRRIPLGLLSLTSWYCFGTFRHDHDIFHVFSQSIRMLSEKTWKISFGKEDLLSFSKLLRRMKSNCFHLKPTARSENPQQESSIGQCSHQCFFVFTLPAYRKR